MNTFGVRNYFGQKAADAFDRFILNRDNWESRRFGVEDRFAASDLEWIRNQVISPSVIDDCRVEFIRTIGQQYFDQFYKRMSGNIPIPIRWEADRILTFNGVVVAAVDVKAKGPDYSNWAIEIMALLANSKAHTRYGCPMYYAFPPADPENDLHGYYKHWTLATALEIISQGKYQDGRFANGSGTPFFTVWQPNIKNKLTDFMYEIESEFKRNE